MNRRTLLEDATKPYSDNSERLFSTCRNSGPDLVPPNLSGSVRVMPARPPVPNVFKIAFTGLVGTYNFACILHATWSGTTPSAATCIGLATTLNDAWGTNMNSLFNSTVVMENVTLTDLTSSSGASGNYAHNQAGGSAGSEIAGNTSVLVTYPSSFRYRGGHPRTYLPPPPQSLLLNPGELTTGAVTSYGTGWGTLLGTLAGSSAAGTTLTQQCAVSYFTDNAARTTPVVMPISSYSVQQRLASQRRRIGRK